MIEPTFVMPTSPRRIASPATNLTSGRH